MEKSDKKSRRKEIIRERQARKFAGGWEKTEDRASKALTENPFRSGFVSFYHEIHEY